MFLHEHRSNDSQHEPLSHHLNYCANNIEQMIEADYY